MNTRVADFEKSQKSLNKISSRAGNFVKNIGANLLASFGSMAAWTAIIGAISGVINIIDGLNMSADEAATVTSDAIQSY